MSVLESNYRQQSEEYLAKLGDISTDMNTSMDRMRANLAHVWKQVEQSVQDVKDMMSTVTKFKANIWNKNCQVTGHIMHLISFNLGKNSISLFCLF